MENKCIKKDGRRMFSFYAFIACAHKIGVRISKWLRSRFKGHLYRCVSVIFVVRLFIPCIALADDTAEERIGRNKTNASSHYFTDVEYAYRKVPLKRGGWDSRKAEFKAFTARFGVRHLPQSLRRLFPKFDGQLEYFVSATAEQLRQDNRSNKNACGVTTDIIHTDLSPVIGLGIGANTLGPGRLLFRARLEAQYGEYKSVSYSRRFAGNEYNVQADISVFSGSINLEWRYQLGFFEPFLAYNNYEVSLDKNLVYPSPSVGTSGSFMDENANIHGLAVGTWIKLGADTGVRLARHFFNQDAYTIQSEIRF